MIFDGTKFNVMGFGKGIFSNNEMIKEIKHSNQTHYIYNNDKLSMIHDCIKRTTIKEKQIN